MPELMMPISIINPHHRRQQPGVFALPFTWSGLVDHILATFGQNTRFIPMAMHAPQGSSSSGSSHASGESSSDGGGVGGSNGGGEIIQVIVFDAQYTDVAAHLYYNPQTSRLKADSVCRQPAAVKQGGGNISSGGSAVDGSGGGDGSVSDNDDGGGDDAEESVQVVAERRHMAAVVNMICCNLWSNL